MTIPRERFAFGVVLSLWLGLLLGKTLVGGKVLSSADILFATASFQDVSGPSYEPANRLLIDPVLQFQPWLAFSRNAIRSGQLPLWNDLAGCGAPFLANAQSAPFDPVHILAYLGRLPEAYAFMALIRLWLAGFGMFLLANHWGIGPWGRWFSGLTFPLTGFLIVWLAYPVTSVAVLLPWLILTLDRLFEVSTLQRAGQLGLVVGLTLLGGHIQTSAHVLLAGGVFVLWRLAALDLSRWQRLVTKILLGLGLGLGIGAITILPLWVYLGKSPTWKARRAEFRSPWTIDQPRLLDSLCLAVPYLYGSQRRGDPNLARALGVHNLNESAGGFTGLVTLIWLAPEALRRRTRRRFPVVIFLLGLTCFGLLASYRISPFSNVLRVLPILDVTDHRRLSLWVAFGLSLLGGFGLDQLRKRRIGLFEQVWIVCGLAVALLALTLAFALPRFESTLIQKSSRHYQQALNDSERGNLWEAQQRATRQVRYLLERTPRQLYLVSAELVGLVGLFRILQERRRCFRKVRVALFALCLLELFAFAYDYNPAIDPADHRPETALMRYLQQTVGSSGRILGIGEELAPNTLMRYGLADIRNYDSIELQRSLEPLKSLYSPDARELTSRGTIGWNQVEAALDQLEQGSVQALISRSPPPSKLKLASKPVGSVWVSQIHGRPLFESVPYSVMRERSRQPGRLEFEVDASSKTKLLIRTTYDEGWIATWNAQPLGINIFQGQFLSVTLPSGIHRLVLDYRPNEVKVALLISITALTITLTTLFSSSVFSVKGLDDLASSG